MFFFFVGFVKSMRTLFFKQKSRKTFFQFLNIFFFLNRDSRFLSQFLIKKKSVNHSVTSFIYNISTCMCWCHHHGYSLMHFTHIENNTPLAFIFDWGVSYWPRAYDKEHPFAWGLACRLCFCPRALARGQKHSLQASLRAKGCSFSLGTRSIWEPRGQI